MKYDKCLELLEKASPQTPDLKKISELPGAVAPGPHCFARVLGRGMKADRCLEWLERALLKLKI